MSQRPEKVLVLGNGVSAFLAVIRSLGRRGLEVHVAWCQADSPALASRYVSKSHQLPFCDSASDWAKQLAALFDAEQFAMVLPTNEQSIRALLRYQRQSTTRAPLCMIDEQLADLVFDKDKCGRLAESLGLKVPKTQVVTTADELDDAVTQLGYPLVLKPVSSYDANAPVSRRSVVKAYGPDELERHRHTMLAMGAILVQENFVGRGVGVELLVDRGKILLPFQHERVHQPMRGGASSYRKSVPLTPELLEASEQFVAALKYSGVIMMEFLVNRHGDWRFVEANGRFWGSLPLAIAAGADFPYDLYRYWVHGDRNFPQHYRENIYCRDLVSDGLWFLENLRADRTDTTLAAISPLSVLLEARHFFAGRERFDTLTLDDPKPAFAEIAKYARQVGRRVGLRARQASVGLPGVRSWQSSRTRAALSRSTNVVFLCWGNICRSPFAAEYARRVWPAHLEIRSRGLLDRQDRVSPNDAQEAALLLNVPLDEHRSSLLSDDDIAAADMIFCFDEFIRSELLRRHPQARSKAFRFGMLSPQGRVTVDDPFGGDLPAFQAAYAQIKATLDSSCELFDRVVPDGTALPL